MKKSDSVCMENKEQEFYEVENRYCPICGAHVKAFSPFHHCDEKKLNKIEKKDRIKEAQQEAIREERTFTDRLEEFEEYYDSDSYYDNDEN
jgi:hypothetical protein